MFVIIAVGSFGQFGEGAETYSDVQVGKLSEVKNVDLTAIS